LLLTLVAPGVLAQTHVANPFVGATQYVNPDYATEVNAAIATETAGSTIAKQMAVVATYPTAIWMDRIGAIAGSSTRKSLAANITAALAQQSGSTPVLITIVIYDLPDRDCAALASNGELSIAGGDTPNGSTTKLTGTGLQEYENDYITPIYNVLATYKTNANVRFVLVIEPDSLPNLVTNTGLSSTEANCVAANNGQTGTASLSGVYAEGITYALNTFHALPNAYQYLDIGQSAWLGWTSNLPPAITLYHGLVTGTTAGYASIDGFISNTANYIPVKEPFMTATEEIGGNEVESSTFYQYNPEIDEIDYDQAFYSAATAAGFPSTIGFLIDTSRNGWGGSLRPTAASTSTDLNTFVDASKLDERPVRGVWCNIQNAGIGVPPTATPGGFSNLEAYVWIKPPGEADGNYPGSVYNGVTSTTGDPNCNPANTNSLAGGATDSLADSLPAGTFWTTEFAQLVQDAYPVIPSSTAAGFSISASGVSVMQGTTATSSITVSAINGFTGTVALTVSGLPTGVTAAFSPASVSGSAGSTLTFTASNTATVGAATVTVTGTSGSTTETGTLTLTVTARPEFTISVSPTTLSVPVNTNPTVSLTVAYVGGLTGSVSLSASGLPTGVAANFAPSSFNSPGGTATVNFTSQASTPPGTYNVLLTGTDGSTVNSATLTLTIPGSSNGFTLKPSATSLTVAQGSSGTDTITVTDVGTFTGSVSFTESGLPSGVTASFSPTSSTSSSVLTLTASSTATTGAFTVTVTGTSGSTTATTTFTLSVTGSGAGFTLTPSGSTLSVTQGSSGTDTITVKDVNGFTGSVSFAATGMPSGVTASFSPTSSTSSSVLTLTASSTATTGGPVTVTITGTSGSVKATTTIALTVAPSGTGGCTVNYTISPQNTSQFGATISIKNGSTAITSWTLAWSFANGQTVSQLWNGIETQSGASVTVKNEPYNGSIAANATLSGIGFNGTWNGTTNAIPTAISLNGTACTVN
jgi:cellulose 1,4-beta-cellobiosidase